VAVTTATARGSSRTGQLRLPDRSGERVPVSQVPVSRVARCRVAGCQAAGCPAGRCRRERCRVADAQDPRRPLAERTSVLTAPDSKTLRSAVLAAARAPGTTGERHQLDRLQTVSIRRRYDLATGTGRLSPMCRRSARTGDTTATGNSRPGTTARVMAAGCVPTAPARTATRLVLVRALSLLTSAPDLLAMATNATIGRIAGAHSATAVTTQGAQTWATAIRVAGVRYRVTRQVRLSGRCGRRAAARDGPSSTPRCHAAMSGCHPLTTPIRPASPSARWPSLSGRPRRGRATFRCKTR
jgi:hypothetical protein